MAADGDRISALKISDIIPASGHIQQMYCGDCRHHLDLTFLNFDEMVSGIRIRIAGLPTLRCPECSKEHLPDRSRLAIVNLHKKCFEESTPDVTVVRQKNSDDFGLTKISFIYDPDDYHNIPGLKCPVDDGFLQPVFFKRQVLIKYNSSPDYRVKFASTTYGTIVTNEDQICFGINRFYNLVMWLGDIAKLPESEQYYLRSENIQSDHSIGSEFYDGQIEAKFTDPSSEDKLFKLRCELAEACLDRFGKRIAHLDAEVFDLAITFNPPVVDTPDERRHVADALNKIYIESFDNKELKSILLSLGGEADGSGSLKRLQAIFEAVAPTEDITSVLSSLFVLYDLRVAYTHLSSEKKRQECLKKICKRLSVPTDADLMLIYQRLIENMILSFTSLLSLAKAVPPEGG